MVEMSLLHSLWESAQNWQSFRLLKNHNLDSFKDIKQPPQILPLPNSSVISSEEVQEGCRETPTLLMALVGARSIIPSAKSNFQSGLLKT